MTYISIENKIIKSSIKGRYKNETKEEIKEIIDEDFALYVETNIEDITQIAGTLAPLGSMSDIDNAGEFYIPQNNIKVKYGTFSLSDDGQYIYIIDNSNPFISSLRAGEKIQDYIIIQAMDREGSIAESIFTMNIEGTGDCPSGYVGENMPYFSK